MKPFGKNGSITNLLKLLKELPKKKRKIMVNR